MLISTSEGTLDKKTIEEWAQKYHYKKVIPKISYGFGWVENGELQAVLSIGKPASNALCEGVTGKENKHYVYELNRLCAKDTMEAPLSKFVGAVLKDLPNLVLVSYADEGQNHYGKIYQATNWIYTGRTKPRTDIATKGHSRHYLKAESYPNRVTRSPKHRYIMFTGDKRFRKTLRKELKYEVLPYPSGQSERYEINWES